MSLLTLPRRLPTGVAYSLTMPLGEVIILDGEGERAVISPRPLTVAAVNIPVLPLLPVLLDREEMSAAAASARANAPAAPPPAPPSTLDPERPPPPAEKDGVDAVEALRDVAGGIATVSLRALLGPLLLLAEEGERGVVRAVVNWGERGLLAVPLLLKLPRRVDGAAGGAPTSSAPIGRRATTTRPPLLPPIDDCKEVAGEVLLSD